MDALKQEKLHRFLSATKFAVVGASNDTSKYGFKDFKWLIDRKKDAVPVNLKPGEILGIKCFQSLSQLPDPTHTAVVIVVPPKATLDVLQQAKDLNMFACWVQPGAENDDVVKFIQADAELEAKSLYDGAALHVLAGSKIVTPKTTPTCPGIISQGSEILDTVKVAAVNLVRVDAAPIRTLEDKKRLFLSAHKFAVVGASANSSKNGAKALKYLLDLHKDVVPINLTADEIQGVKCLQTISQLPDITHTSISIVVPPKATLQVVKQAQSLNAFALWIQPGAEDDDVAHLIESDPKLSARCVYREHPLHTSGLGPKALFVKPIENTTPTCLFATPPLVSEKTTIPAPPASLAADNLVAGVKRDMLSPPSTPQPSKAPKLAPDDHIVNLDQEIPGLA